MDTVAILDQVKRPDTDVSFKMSFTKARERAPLNRSEFQPVEIALVNDEWVHRPTENIETGADKKVSPSARKFFEALKQAVSQAGQVGVRGVDKQAWTAACGRAGLVNVEQKQDSARALVSKYRRELDQAGMIGCEGDRSWPTA